MGRAENWHQETLYNKMLQGFAGLGEPLDAISHLSEYVCALDAENWDQLVEAVDLDPDQAHLWAGQAWFDPSLADGVEIVECQNRLLTCNDEGTFLILL